jgi:hypothetical protein
MLRSSILTGLVAVTLAPRAFAQTAEAPDTAPAPAESGTAETAVAQTDVAPPVVAPPAVAPPAAANPVSPSAPPAPVTDAAVAASLSASRTTDAGATTDRLPSDTEDGMSMLGRRAVGVGRSYPYLSAGLRVELEYLDVEGDGGFANRPTSVIAPRQRAPVVDIDKATLDLRSHLRPWLDARVELRTDATSARIDRLYLEGRAWDDRIRVELGRQKPMQRSDLRTETYSPIQAAFWKGREVHVGADVGLPVGPAQLRFIPSVAMQRSLGDEPMGEDTNLPTTAFVDAAPDEDAELELGGLVGAEAYGVSAAAFGFRGKLLDNQGPDRLKRTFDAYPLLGDPADRTNLWYGARAQYDGYGVAVAYEQIWHQLGNIRRTGFDASLAYAYRFELFDQPMIVAPFVRFGTLTITNLPEQFEVPESWDREQRVAALAFQPIDQVTLRVEYLMLRERAGMSSEGTDSVADDQLLVQIALQHMVDEL